MNTTSLPNYKLINNTIISNNGLKTKDVNIFYIILKEKYMDKRCPIFFNEFIETMCNCNTICPETFREYYNSKYIYEIEQLKKYRSSFTDIYNIAYLQFLDTCIKSWHI